MTLVTALQWVSIVLLWIMIGVQLFVTWRWRGITARAHDTAEAALELLDLLEQSQDPGRDVHERFARVLESGMIRDEGPPDPAMRRAASMAMAAELIGTIRRANLELVAADVDEA